MENKHTAGICSTVIEYMKLTLYKSEIFEYFFSALYCILGANSGRGSEQSFGFFAYWVQKKEKDNEI